MPFIVKKVKPFSEAKTRQMIRETAELFGQSERQWFYGGSLGLYLNISRLPRTPFDADINIMEEDLSYYQRFLEDTGSVPIKTNTIGASLGLTKKNLGYHALRNAYHLVTSRLGLKLCEYALTGEATKIYYRPESGLILDLKTMVNDGDRVMSTEYPSVPMAFAHDAVRRVDYVDLETLKAFKGLNTAQPKAGPDLEFILRANSSSDV